jgi:hypothetical protein
VTHRRRATQASKLKMLRLLCEFGIIPGSVPGSPLWPRLSRDGLPCMGR